MTIVFGLLFLLAITYGLWRFAELVAVIRPDRDWDRKGGKS